MRIPLPVRLPRIGGPRSPEPSSEPSVPPGDGPPLGLGPGSLTWRLFGESYMALTAGSVGLLQTMHPAIGASLVQHSNFFDDPLDRIMRSVPHIMRVVYADPHAAPGPTDAGELVRGFHRTIRGTDDQGRDYDALDGETFFWAHVTFVHGIVAGTERLGVPLTDEELDQLWAEALLWYRRYGADDSAVPADRAALEAWFEHMCAEVLERNATSQGILDAARNGVPCPVPGLPDGVWRLVQRPLLGAWLWVGIGALPPSARETLGVRWRDRDEQLLAVLRTGIRGLNGVLPPVLRYHPIAHRAIRDLARANRVSFRRAVDGPL
ncbi:oxygenase MpaB family protein [Patulibacter minatonensis]|uniref:oxygenase MpaB family protein n=1 Tax=Patulibacter minatonensis TaxID=298163 RepID=UPI0004B04B9E|nr:oxygenase MpaB family protein [Patulibacter minatonensis]